jgi:cytochrome b involved in lipid metabolism
MKIFFPIALIVVAGILGYQAFFKAEAPAPMQETITTPEQKIKGYVLAEVATHSTPENCWTVIRGSVYDVTAWITQHPGGEKAILKTCGIDATLLFDNKHGGSEGPEMALDGFKIGVVAE